MTAPTLREDVAALREEVAELRASIKGFSAAIGDAWILAAWACHHGPAGVPPLDTTGPLREELKARGFPDRYRAHARDIRAGSVTMHKHPRSAQDEGTRAT